MSSIRRSSQVMELLARKSPMGVRLVASQLGLPLGSVHRLLLDLEVERIVERTADGEWELSFRLLEITGIQLDRIELPRLARPHMERIAGATGETVNLNALSGRNPVCIDKVRGNERMQLDMRIGSRGVFHCGGSGKVLLAYMPPEDQAGVLAAPLEALTRYTITDPAMLQAEIGRIRSRGYAIDNQEVVIGVYCVSVPILGRDGYPAGSMSITGPSVKHPGPEILPRVAMLTEACGAVSRRLGYVGDWPPLTSVAEAPPLRRSAQG